MVLLKTRFWMEQQKQVKILSELLRQLDENVNVDAGVILRNPTSVYTSPDIAKREWEKFFQNHPQLIGLSTDLPDPGSFMTVDDFGIPVLATRDPDGRFRTFLNACRHRGALIESELRGKKKRFACPFHKWTYDSCGTLIAIPQEDHFGNVDKSCRGLVELPSCEKYGLLWLHPCPGESLNVDQLLGGLAPEIESWNFNKMKRVGETNINMRLNWKLANDTFGETYHFQKLHKDTVGRIFYGDALSYEALGKNHRFVFPNRGIDRLREQPKEDWRITHGAVIIYYLFPNVQLALGRGTINLIRIYPDRTNPGRSNTQISHYFSDRLLEVKAEAGEDVPKLTSKNVYDMEARQGALPDVDAQNEVFVSTISQQDYVMGESIQNAVENGLLDHVIFGRNEPALHHFHNTFRASLDMPPLQEYVG